MLLLLMLCWVNFTFERNQNTFFACNLSAHLATLPILLAPTVVDFSFLAPINNHGKLATHIIQNKLEATKNFLDLDTCYGNTFILKAQKRWVYGSIVSKETCNRILKTEALTILQSISSSFLDMPLNTKAVPDHKNTSYFEQLLK